MTTERTGRNGTYLRATRRALPRHGPRPAVGGTRKGSSGSQSVGRLHPAIGDEALGVLQKDELGKDEKLVVIKDLLDRYTDLDLLAKLVLGKYWRTASEGERKAYTDTFRQLVMKTMADRLHEYGGETFEVVGSREINDRDSLVATNILRPSGAPPIQVEWRVRSEDVGQRIIDVVAEGISLVVTQRSEVGDIVSKEGMDGLIEVMRKRLDHDPNAASSG
ncbi:MAG: ABC transporter substrate-binding protein [Geminicoccaceae bacterium]